LSPRSTRSRASVAPSALARRAEQKPSKLDEKSSTYAPPTFVRLTPAELVAGGDECCDSVLSALRVMRRRAAARGGLGWPFVLCVARRCAPIRLVAAGPAFCGERGS